MQLNQRSIYKDALLEILMKASHEFLQLVENEYEVQEKDDATVVTAIDRSLEMLIRNEIQKKFPDHGIIGEEFGSDNPTAELCWVIDPIDGTYSLVNGSFDFGIQLGLTYLDSAILGGISHPHLSMIYLGDNTSATLNNKPIQIRRCNSIENSFLLSTDFYDYKRFSNPTGFKQLLESVSACRTWGNCFGFTQLARGKADIVVEPVMKPWDSIAMLPIVRGAGAFVTGFYGEQAEFADNIVASNPTIHQQVLAILNHQINLERD
jgi:histidinol-phosphatase